MRDVSDYNLLMLLFAGTGPVARQHPEIVDAFGFAANRQEADLRALDEVITRYQEVAPEFRTKIAPMVRSGDPVKVRSGLEKFKLSFLAFYENDPLFAQLREYVAQSAETLAREGLAKGGPGAVPMANVNAVQGVNVAYGVNIVAAAAAVAGTVAAAVTLVVLVGAVFVVYLTDPGSTDTSLDMRLQMASLVESLAA